MVFNLVDRHILLFHFEFYHENSEHGNPFEKIRLVSYKNSHIKNKSIDDKKEIIRIIVIFHYYLKKKSKDLKL